mmetsp:Transcript_67939/g.178165  ORF Transcript_67939/g.178165 Transcript_67939/m.178165 type:complete len:698 (+) Transcript_67939:136-2229(+)
MPAWPKAVADSAAVKNGTGRSNGAMGLGAGCCFLLFVLKFNEKVQTYKASKNITSGKAIDAHLMETMTRILRSTCGHREAFTVAKLSLCLLLRTFGSVWVARHWGKMVNALVARRFARIRRLVVQFAGVTVGLAALNAFLKYYIAGLKLEVREKVTRWCHDMYMRPVDLIFYKANKVGEDKIDNCDHQITSDVDRFSEMFAEILSQSLKPIVDFLVYSYELSRIQGLFTPVTLYSWFAVAHVISSVTLPPFGELAATEQHLEGQFRSAHSSMIANCEQIAFLGGERPEKAVLDSSFNKLMSHCFHSIRLSFNSEIVRQYLSKYFVTVIGLFLIARPVRLGYNGMDKWQGDQIAAYFTSTWRNMELMSSSIQDLFELTNRIGKLSGFAARLKKLMAGLEERPPVLENQIASARRGPYPPQYVEGDGMEFDHVSVYRPDGTLLVKDLNFSIKRGERVLITGPNGCGKSSLFRVIRKLWPLVEGTITMPAEKSIYFLSQVNFVPLGTLRDLVTYPQSKAGMLEEGRTDQDVFDCLEWAHVSPEVLEGEEKADLEFIDDGRVVRPRLDDVRDWSKDLSPGQKQRVAFARLFYHRPSFAVLDECTNGISPDVEHDLYDRCTKLNMAVFSISHKIELKLFHDYELHYNGDAEGTWEMMRCSETTGKVTKSSSTVKAAPTRPSNARTPMRQGSHAQLLYERHVA